MVACIPGRSPTRAPLCADKLVSGVWRRKKAHEYSSCRAAAGSFQLGTLLPLSPYRSETTCMTALLLQRQIKMHKSLTQFFHAPFLQHFSGLPRSLSWMSKSLQSVCLSPCWPHKKHPPPLSLFSDPDTRSFFHFFPENHNSQHPGAFAHAVTAVWNLILPLVPPVS